MQKLKRKPHELDRDRVETCAASLRFHENSKRKEKMGSLYLCVVLPLRCNGAKMWKSISYSLLGSPNAHPWNLHPHNRKMAHIACGSRGISQGTTFSSRLFAGHWGWWENRRCWISTRSRRTWMFINEVIHASSGDHSPVLFHIDRFFFFAQLHISLAALLAYCSLLRKRV